MILLLSGKFTLQEMLSIVEEAIMLLGLKRVVQKGPFVVSRAYFLACGSVLFCVYGHVCGLVVWEWD